MRVILPRASFLIWVLNLWQIFLFPLKKIFRCKLRCKISIFTEKPSETVDCAMLLASLNKMLEKMLSLNEHTYILGGLSLYGDITTFNGIISSLQQGFKRIFIPRLIPVFFNRGGSLWGAKTSVASRSL